MSSRARLRSGGAVASAVDVGKANSGETASKKDWAKAKARQSKNQDELFLMMSRPLDRPEMESGNVIESALSQSASRSNVSGLTGSASNIADRVCYTSVKTRFLNILLMTRSHSSATFHVPRVNHHFVTLSNTMEPRASGKSMVDMFSTSFNDDERKEYDEYIRAMLKGVVLSCFVLGSPASANGGLDLHDIESSVRVSSSGELVVLKWLETRLFVLSISNIFFSFAEVAVLVKPTPKVVELLSIDVSNDSGLIKFCYACGFSVPSGIKEKTDYRTAFELVQNEYQLRPGSVFFAPVEGAHRTFSARRVMMNLSIGIDMSCSMLNDDMCIELTDELDASKLRDRSQKIVASIMSSVIQSTGDQVGSLLIAVLGALKQRVNFIHRYNSTSSKSTRNEQVRADAFAQMRAVSMAVLNCVFPSRKEGVPEEDAVHHEILANLFRAILIPKDGDYKKNFATLDIDLSVTDPTEQMREIGNAFRLMVTARIKSYGWIPHKGNVKGLCCMPKELKGLFQVITHLIGSGVSEEAFTNQLVRCLFADLPTLYSFCFHVNCLVLSANNLGNAECIDVIYAELVIFQKLVGSISERLRSPDSVSVRSVLIDVHKLREKLVSLNLPIGEIVKLSRVDKLDVVDGLWTQRNLSRHEAVESGSDDSKSTSPVTNRGSTGKKSSASASARSAAISFDVGSIQPPKKQRSFKTEGDANRSAMKYLEVMKGVFDRALSDAQADQTKALTIVNGLGESVQAIFCSDNGGDSSAPSAANGGSAGIDSSSAVQAEAASIAPATGG
jgi:hypothetical protein